MTTDNSATLYNDEYAEQIKDSEITKYHIHIIDAMYLGVPKGHMMLTFDTEIKQQEFMLKEVLAKYPPKRFTYHFMVSNKEGVLFYQSSIIS